jgi:undecaprenyl diphosphate synthase
MVHIGIIPDGNRRWYKSMDDNGKTLVDIWMDLLIKHIIKINNNKFLYLKEITEVSLYICSVDNIKREDDTKDNIFELFEKIYKLVDKSTNTFNEKTASYFLNFIENTKINLVGELDMLPERIKEILYKLSQMCKTEKYILNLAIAYDYNKDLINYGHDIFKNYIRKQSNIDFVLRTGGESRISGFFPTKTLYSELFFSKKMWPDITIVDINNYIRKFKNRNRRFGK